MGNRFKLNEKALNSLQEFENNLNPQDPEAGAMNPKIIGYGEMSTVFCFGAPELNSYAFKRMSIFDSEQEVQSYQETFLNYHSTLKQRGISTPDFDCEMLEGKNGKKVIYLLQSLLKPETIANQLLKTKTKEENLSIYKQILAGINSVFKGNIEESKKIKSIEIGFDGQISNWSYDQKLLYIDTSTPLLRENGIEKLNAELFLRICPSYLVWIIRLFFLKDVLNRYYDMRLVIIDTLANLYKEQKEEWLPDYIFVANEFLKVHRPDIKPIIIKEIESYYAEDKMIWRLFLFFRKLERTIRIKILRKTYDIILPGNIIR
jgi:hypothetical protein